MNRISVLLCCYNGAATVGRACESIFAQTFPADRTEVLFVDDGSSDGTPQVARRFESRANFRILRNRVNCGLPQSCNRALAEARGEFVIRMDADDFAEPALLEESCREMETGGTDLVTCDRWEIPPDGSERRVVRLGEFDLYRLTAAGTLMRRKMVLEAGGYRDLFWEEYDLYLRYLLLSGKKPRHVARPLYTYHLRPGNMTSDPRRVGEGWEELKRLWPQETLERFGRLPALAGPLHA